jgi:hypothetical protein
VALLVPAQTWCVFTLNFFFLLPPTNSPLLPHLVHPPSARSFSCNTRRNAHQEDYIALDDAEFRNVISILKLLALGAHKVCRALHVPSFAYDVLFRLHPPLFFCSLSFGTTWVEGWKETYGSTPPKSLGHTRPAKGRPITSGVNFSPPVDRRRREGAVIRLRLFRRFLFRFLFRPLPYPGSDLPVHLTRPSDHPFALPPLDPFYKCLVCLFVCPYPNSVLCHSPFFLFFLAFLLFVSSAS